MDRVRVNRDGAGRIYPIVTVATHATIVCADRLITDQCVANVLRSSIRSSKMVCSSMHAWPTELQKKNTKKSFEIDS